MSTVTQSGTRSSGKRIGALILAIVGILLVILAVIYLVTAAGSLPSFIPGHINGSTGHHPLRARFIETRLEDGQHRHADGPYETRHGWQQARAANFTQQKRKAVQQFIGISNQQSGQHRVQRAVRKSSIHEQEHPVLREQTFGQRSEVGLIEITGRLF